MKSTQSKIEKLISELCPNGVEFLDIKKLWIKAPKSRLGVAQVKELGEGNNICFTSGKSIFYVSDYLVDGEYIFMNDGGVADTKFNKGKAYYTDHTFTFTVDKTKVLPKFVYFILKENEKYINDILFKGTGLKNLNKKAFENFKIPIPPLAIQEEIVKILNSFTELEAELEAELEVRKKQYDYYHKELFDLRDDFELKTLGDIYEFQYGEGNTIPTSGDKFPVYGSNGIVGSHEKFNSEDAPVIGHIGAYAGIVNWAQGKHFVTYNGVICKIKPGVNPRFGYHLLILQDFRSKANAGSQPFVSYDMLRKTEVKITPILIQNKIADILDKFDALVNDISVGLPAELKARRSQYEYYRNKLLDFKELEK